MNEARFVTSRLIHASNDVVWNVLGDFGNEHVWTKTVQQYHRDTVGVRVGTVRTCKLPRPLMGRTEVREALTEFEYGQSLAYVLDGAAGPFAKAESRWSTRPVGDGSTEVVVEAALK